LNDFKQMLIGITIIIGGVNFVGFGIIFNGANHAANPVWGFFASFFYSETIVAAILICGFFLFFILSFESKENIQPKPIAINEISKRQEITDEKPPKIKVEPVFVQPVAIIPEPEPPPKPKPTAAELKRKALDQITGREFK